MWFGRMWFGWMWFGGTWHSWIQLLPTPHMQYTQIHWVESRGLYLDGRGGGLSGKGSLSSRQGLALYKRSHKHLHLQKIREKFLVQLNVIWLNVIWLSVIWLNVICLNGIWRALLSWAVPLWFDIIYILFYFLFTAKCISNYSSGMVSFLIISLFLGKTHILFLFYYILIYIYIYIIL